MLSKLKSTAGTGITTSISIEEVTGCEFRGLSRLGSVELIGFIERMRRSGEKGKEGEGKGGEI